MVAVSLGLGACGGGEPQLPPYVARETIGSIGSGFRKGSLAVSHDHRRLAWVQEVGDRCRIVADGERGPLLWRCLNPAFSRDGVTLAYWAGPEPSDPPRGYLYVNGEPVDVPIGGDGPIVFSRAGGGWAAVGAPYDPSRPPAPDDLASPAAVGSPVAEASPAAVATPGGVASPVAAAAPPPRRRLVVLSSLGTLGEHLDTTTPAVSPDGRHVAYVAADAQGQKSLIVDGAVVRTFAPPTVTFLPVVQPETPGPNLDPEWSVHYLADGSLVTIGLAEGGWTVFHDADVWATYTAVNIPKTGFQVTDPQLVASRTIVAGSLATAADAPVACWWERLEGPFDRWRVVCNGAPIDDHVCSDYAVDTPIVLSDDGGSVAYVCREIPTPESSGGPPPYAVVFAGRKLDPHPFVWGLDVSGDGRHYAYGAADSVEEPWFYVVDGRRYTGPWMRIFPPQLSFDGGSVAWAASRQEEDAQRVDLVFDGDTVSRADIVMAPPLFRGPLKVQWAVRRGSSVRRLSFCTRPAPFEWLRPLVCR